MVDFVLEIHRKLADFYYKIDLISKTENWFFIPFSTFRIFHVNLATFEKKKNAPPCMQKTEEIIAKYAVDANQWG